MVVVVWIGLLGAYAALKGAAKPVLKPGVKTVPTPSRVVAKPVGKTPAAKAVAKPKRRATATRLRRRSR